MRLLPGVNTGRTTVGRLASLLGRYRVDRRLPPPVRELFAETLRLRWAEAAARRRAALLPVLGPHAGDEIGRLDDRRVGTAGVLDVPVTEHALRTAATVCRVLEDAGLAPFVVDRAGERLRLGLLLDARRRALVALGELGTEVGWFVGWADRGDSGVVPLRDAPRHRRVARARSLDVFHSHRIGERATGSDWGVRITWWQPGTSGLLELVGTRGHDRFDARSPATVEVVEGHRFPGRTAFPIAADLGRLDQPVDVVVTWVDGSDPAWQESFRSTAAEHGRRLDEAALDPARYRSRDELRYALRSIWMYCGWVRRIHLVTAGQRPSWLVDDDRITVVDHRQILPATALPTFNSHAIEAALHRVPGLAEHFVYFNDDILAARPLRPETFFTSNGLARVFSSEARVPGFEDEHTPAVDTAARRGRDLLLRRFGRAVAHKPFHCPHPLRRSVLEEIERELCEDVAATQHSRFRSPTDLSIASSFGQHYAIATGRAVFGLIASDYVHVESGRLGWHLDRIRLGRDIDTYCVNETQDRGPDEERERLVQRFLDEMLPIPAPWERAAPSSGA